MDKKTIFFLLIAGFLSFPVLVNAQECYARITKTDVYNNFPEVTIQLMNAGIENADTLRIASDQYTTEHLICPLGFNANSTNPQSVTCSLPSRHLELTEVNKISLAYSGSQAGYGNYETPYHFATTTGFLSNYNNWIDPDKLYVADNDYSTYSLTYPNPTYTGQIIGGFGSFAIPDGSVITGITIEAKGYVNNWNNYGTVSLLLSSDGMATYQHNSPGNDLLWYNLPGFTGAVHTFVTNSGHNSFTEDGQWTPAKLNSGNFSLVAFTASNQNVNFSIDYFKVKVLYKSVDLACFGAYIDGVQCGSSLGTLCPQPETGGVVVPKTCDPLDYFCKFQQWASTTFLYWFGFDEDFASEQFDALYSWLNYKFPFGYLAPLQASGFGTPIGSPSATLSDVNISFTPKMVHNGETSDLTPVALTVPKETFNPVQPFLGYLRGFFIVIIYFSLGLFILFNAGRFFT